MFSKANHGLIVALGVVLMLVSSGCASISSNGGDLPNNSAGSNASFLYLQYAERGSLVLIGDGDPNHYTLTLNDVVPVTTYFSERPQRIAGTIQMADFIRLPGLFDDEDPPNVAVSAFSPQDNVEGAVVLELRNPIYDAQLNNLFYDAVVVQGRGANGLTPWGRESGAVLPRNLEQINVFIDHDQCPGTVNPQCTD